MAQVECEFCGDEYDEQGLAAHQRYCDEAEEAGSNNDAEYSELEETGLERDDRSCECCEDEDNLVVHEINPKYDDDIRYLVTLCKDCEAEIEGYHPRTKRTKIDE